MPHMLHFMNLTRDQLERFEGLKTDRDLAHHGPLARGQEVPVHCHKERSLYLVRGKAEFTDGKDGRVVGDGAECNAVVISANQNHGWRSLADGVMIEHCFGVNVDRILAIA